MIIFLIDRWVFATIRGKLMMMDGVFSIYTREMDDWGMWNVHLRVIHASLEGIACYHN